MICNGLSHSSMKKHHSALPLPEARGLNREQAAAYIGVSASLFDEMIRDGRMPEAKSINTRKVWDRRRLDSAFEKLPSGDDEDWSVEL